MSDTSKKQISRGLALLGVQLFTASSVILIGIELLTGEHDSLLFVSLAMQAFCASALYD